MNVRAYWGNDEVSKFEFLKGKQVTAVVASDNNRELIIGFSDGSSLILKSKVSDIWIEK